MYIFNQHQQSHLRWKWYICFHCRHWQSKFKRTII